jgi:hypothetical protein
MGDKLRHGAALRGRIDHLGNSGRVARPIPATNLASDMSVHIRKPQYDWKKDSLCYDTSEICTVRMA